MNFEETLTELFTLLELMNKADTRGAQNWQKASDARAPYEHIRAAIVSLAGEEIVRYFSEVGEIDMTLAVR